MPFGRSTLADDARSDEPTTRRLPPDLQQCRSAAKPRARDRGSLMVVCGPGAGEILTFDSRPVTIGRAVDCDLRIPDSAVSRYHAICRRTPNAGFVLEDLGTTNGTWYAGRRLLGSRPISDGQRFLIGDSVLSFSTMDIFEQSATRHVCEEALRDGMTDLWNRRYFDQALARALVLGAREQTPVAVFMVDVDHFKRINDRHGHVAGDVVLRAIAQRLRANVRPEDTVARFGGEEFAIISRGIAQTDAWRTAQRLRAVVADDPLSVGPGCAPLTVTISVGLQWIAGRPDVSAQQLVAYADQALYEAKRQGRNAVRSGPAPRMSESGSWQRPSERREMSDPSVKQPVFAREPKAL